MEEEEDLNRGALVRHRIGMNRWAHECGVPLSRNSGVTWGIPCEGILVREVERRTLTCPGQDQRDVVGLFFIANPGVDCHGDDLTDLGER